MNEPPHDPPAHDPPPQNPQRDPQGGGAQAGGAPDTPDALGARDASAGTPERPPPYQGTYGAQPGQAPPAPGHAHPGQPPHGHPAPPHPGPPHAGPPHAGGQDMLAGRWARLGAALLDTLILGFVAAPAALFSIRWDKMEESIESGEPVTNPLDLYNIPRLVIGYTIVFLVGFAYYTVLHARWGQTLGKKAAGIRVVRAADHSAVSWGQAIGRQAFVYLISITTALLNFFVPGGAILGLLGMLDPAWILWDDRRQAVHDKVAGTVVVKTPPWVPDPYARPRSGNR
ncbi:RDD family protein [Actinomadura welshii]